MKINLFIFIIIFYRLTIATGQTLAAIETDLLKAFKKIKQEEDRDKIDIYNSQFTKKLKYYTEKFPNTLHQKFSNLIANHLDITSSTDGKFRIYSWDTNTGGTMYIWADVMQYKIGHKIYAKVDTFKDSDKDIGCNYTKMYTFKGNGKTYYLCNTQVIESSKYYAIGLQCFTIDDRKLNVKAKIIKTNSGLNSRIWYEFDTSPFKSWKEHPTIIFDEKNNTLKMPLIDAKGRVTHKFIIYKFTGQYFERIRN